MTAKLSTLEEQAYTLVGHPFSLSATEDIAQVCYWDLYCYLPLKSKLTL